MPQYLHAVDAVEALTKTTQKIDMAVALQALATFRARGVQIRRDMDDAFLEGVAALKAGHSIALGDCLELALTRRLLAEDASAAFYTADRGEMSLQRGRRVPHRLRWLSTQVLAWRQMESKRNLAVTIG